MRNANYVNFRLGCTGFVKNREPALRRVYEMIRVEIS